MIQEWWTNLIFSLLRMKMILTFIAVVLWAISSPQHKMQQCYLSITFCKGNFFAFFHPLKNVFQVAPVINYLFCNNEYPRNIRWYCESIRVRSKLSVNWCFHKYQILNNYSIFTLCFKCCCLLHFSWMPSIATLIIYLPFEFFTMMFLLTCQGKMLLEWFANSMGSKLHSFRMSNFWWILLCLKT